jgi:pimeloyl-ACP methyl ester carboxylesterase
MMKSIQFRNVQLSFWDSGSGPAVILTHGFPLDHRMWAAQIPVLEKFCRVIAVDLPGYGSSPLPNEPLSIKGYAEAVAAIMAAEKIEQATLVGLSMGGYVGWEYAAHFPQSVSRLVACNTRAAGDNVATAKARKISAQNVRDNGTTALVTDMLNRLVAPQTQTDSLEVIAQIRTMMNSATPESVSATLLALADRADNRSILPQLKIPVLVVAGEFDAITPAEEMREMSTTLEHASFKIVPGCGHLPPMEQPERFNDVLVDFLKTN